jgi:hypothetical protein
MRPIFFFGGGGFSEKIIHVEKFENEVQIADRWEC